MPLLAFQKASRVCEGYHCCWHCCWIPAWPGQESACSTCSVSRSSLVLNVAFLGRGVHWTFFLHLQPVPCLLALWCVFLTCSLGMNACALCFAPLFILVRAKPEPSEFYIWVLYKHLRIELVPEVKVCSACLCGSSHPCTNITKIKPKPSQQTSKAPSERRERGNERIAVISTKLSPGLSVVVIIVTLLQRLACVHLAIMLREAGPAPGMPRLVPTS